MNLTYLRTAYERTGRRKPLSKTYGRAACYNRGVYKEDSLRTISVIREGDRELFSVALVLTLLTQLGTQPLRRPLNYLLQLVPVLLAPQQIFAHISTDMHYPSIADSP